MSLYIGVANNMVNKLKVFIIKNKSFKDNNIEPGCDTCYYELFDENAYPCSMCIRGYERIDKFQPKQRNV